jgi:hypothetical protein
VHKYPLAKEFVTIVPIHQSICSKNQIWKIDSATLQSLQLMINSVYMQLSIQSTPLLTASVNHLIRGHMFGASECLPTFDARTFPSVFTTSVVQELNGKIADFDVCCVDYPLRCMTHKADPEKWSFFQRKGLGAYSINSFLD